MGNACVTPELGKYIPPHLRRKQSQQSSGEEHRELSERELYRRSSESGFHRGSNYYRDDSRDEASSEYDLRRSYGRSEERGVHSTQNYFTPHHSVDDKKPGRWDALSSDPEPPRSFPRRRGAMTNKLGFHGSLSPSRFLENKLFDSSDHVTEGINFDNVRLLCVRDV